MKLSELINQMRAQYPDEKDPEVKLSTYDGFFDINYVLNRQDFHDETLFGSKVENGNYILICSEAY
jgi:hypothetical protein